MYAQKHTQKRYSAVHAHHAQCHIRMYALGIVDVLNVPAVYFHVAAEITGMPKTCFTHSADVRLLASVSAHVRPKMA